jgi:hypothetical protein
LNRRQRKKQNVLQRCREHAIEKRNAYISKRGEALRWSKKLHNNNPYSGFKIENLYKTRKLQTIELMKERARWALDSEESAEEFNIYKVNNPK